MKRVNLDLDAPFSGYIVSLDVAVGWEVNIGNLDYQALDEAEPANKNPLLATGDFQITRVPSYARGLINQKFMRVRYLFA